MKSAISKTALLLSLIFPALYVYAENLSQSNSVAIEAVGSWVTHQEIPIPGDVPHDDIVDGVYHLLIDKQVDVGPGGDNEYFFHHARLITNQAGLNPSSQLDVGFDPSYEFLTFHTVQIVRNGKLIDKLATTEISILQREQEMENLIYNGRLTANLILDDVRVGDIVDYSYTRRGDNPVYKDIFSYDTYIEYSVPVDHQFLRLRWRKKAPLNVKVLDSNVEVVRSAGSGGVEYTLDRKSTAPRSQNSEVPVWYDPYAKVVFSEVSSWSEVADWALPLYTEAYEHSSEIKKIAAEIKNSSTSVDQEIAAALQFVQREVRYLGIEMGVNSHMPSPASETLHRRYGDCKDKAVLMISLLSELGVEAHPVLVDTQRTKKLAEYLPSVGLFDHVLVKAMHGGKSYWLDPTRPQQWGDLSDIYQPDYGFALVLKSGTQDLTLMTTETINTGLLVIDTFDLSNGGGNEIVYQSTSEYYGSSADSQRSRIDADGLTDKQVQYTEFYKGYYPSLEPIEKLHVEEVKNGSVFRLSEKYAISKFWQVDTDTNDFNATFYANAISTKIVEPKEVSRRDPFSLTYPNEVEQRIVAKLSGKNWEIKSGEFSEENKFFSYRSSVEYDDRNQQLILSYYYKALTDFVPAQELDTYLKARDRAIGDTEYSIVEYFKGEVDTTGNDDFDVESIILLSAVLLYVVGLLFVFINWRLDAAKNRNNGDSVFYPVSLVKLLALSVITSGIYPMYWFYRNWKYVKDKHSSSIMPLARGFFNYFWYYPLYRHLVADSNERYPVNQLPGWFVATLMALIYFGLSLLSSIEGVGIFALFASFLLLLPLANYINHIKQTDGDVYRYNSRWLFRHTVLAVLFVPFLVFLYAGQLNLLPNPAVVQGSDLWGHDLKYLQRKGVVPAGEPIISFYSDAFLSVRNDGNGFTEKRVFSYWRDDGDVFVFESEPLEGVRKIDPYYSKQWDESSTVTIIMDDESEFVLYLPNDSGMDRKFVKLLQEQWVRARASTGNSSALYQMSLHQRQRSSNLGGTTLMNDWLIQAAELGNAKAQYELALSLLAGIDVDTDEHRALELLLLSAQKNLAKSQLFLGELYSKGILVEQSDAQAISWYSRAYGLGDRTAGISLVWHLSTVSDEELRDGEAAVRIAKSLVKGGDRSDSREALAVALAEMGDFEHSLEAQYKAIELSKKEDPHSLSRLAKYQAAEPIRSIWAQNEKGTIGHVPLVKPAPIYPRKAQIEGVVGYVTTEYDVGPDGRVMNIEVVDTDQPNYFEEASIAATKRFLYFPKIVDGVPAIVKGVRNRFTFELED